MTNRKNYNSILFLTVCLGLMLVGGNAQGLSHVATTRIFDFQTEWEVRDDLDNNPDSEEIENIDNDDFPTVFLELLNEIKHFAKLQQIQTPLQTDFYVDSYYQRSENSGGSGSSSTLSDQKLSLIVQESFNKKFSPKAFKMADFDGNDKVVKIKLESNKDEIELKFSISKQNPAAFATFLNKKFSLSLESTNHNLLKRIYQNTKVSSENNQVFIITRLPRASIDSLLK